MESNRLLFVYMKAVPGGHIGNCINEAYIYALTNKVDVHLEHNSRVYFICVKDFGEPHWVHKKDYEG